MMSLRMSMFIPGLGDHTIGRPEVCVRRWNTVIWLRRPAAKLRNDFRHSRGERELAELDRTQRQDVGERLGDGEDAEHRIRAQRPRAPANPRRRRVAWMPTCPWRATMITAAVIELARHVRLDHFLQMRPGAAGPGRSQSSRGLLSVGLHRTVC